MRAFQKDLYETRLKGMNSTDVKWTLRQIKLFFISLVQRVSKKSARVGVHGRFPYSRVQIGMWCEFDMGMKHEEDAAVVRIKHRAAGCRAPDLFKALPQVLKDAG